MGQFLTDPDFHPLPDGRNWRVSDFGLGYKTDAGDIIIAEAGFETDFASVPKMFWNVVPPWGLYGWGAVIHDKLYRTSGLNGKYTREQCDDILKEAMVAKGTPTDQMDIIYNAVRLFGQSAWDEDAKKLAASERLICLYSAGCDVLSKEEFNSRKQSG